jgi:group I intron endonuclease
MNPVMGVYQITNTVNGHVYIGSSVDVHKRWGRHQRELRAGTHHSAYLQRAWNKYGEDAFSFILCEQCEKEHLIEREQYYIDNVKPTYNIAIKAKSCLGVKHTEESKQKMSESKSGAGNPYFGKKRSDETKHKVSKSLIGHTVTEETKQKISQTLKGTHPSEETRLRMSLAHMGRKRSTEINQRGHQ